MPTPRRSHARFLSTVAGMCLLLAACDHYAAAQGTLSPGLTPAPSPVPVTERDTCVPPPISSPIAVALVRRVDGSCAPFDQAFLYRCDPSMPAVAVIDDGNGVRRFLGGTYAVPVPDVPPTGFPMGVTGFGAVYQNPADPAFLWVQADGGIKRWLAIPNRNKVSDPTTARMIGDSILDGGQTDVVAALPTWTLAIDALVGRGSDGAAGVAESLPDPTADAVVIEIGVNDADAAATAANAQRIIAAQGDARVLVWLTAHGPAVDVPAVNAAIVGAMGSIPNGTVLDWDRLVPPNSLSSDGVHPDIGQQDVLASIMAPFLRAWHDAAVGTGPTACEPAIRAAA
ncbi:MAG: hypothetical protein ABJB55_02150 [Actinomycetota bacterium]